MGGVELCYEPEMARAFALAYLGGASERFGFARGLFAFLLNRPDRGFDIPDAPVRHQFRILSKLGVRQLDEHLELWPDEEAERRVETLLGPAAGDRRCVGLVLGSSPRWATKRWPNENFRELASRLARELHCRIVLIGSAEDAVWIKDGNWEKSEHVVNLTGKTGLRDLVPLMKRLDVLVTGDTAPLHIAGAVKTKIVALFGPTDPKRHMPPADGAIVLSRKLSCQPCYSGHCRNADSMACMKQISVQEVFQSVQKHLALRTVHSA